MRSRSRSPNFSSRSNLSALTFNSANKQNSFTSFGYKSDFLQTLAFRLTTQYIFMLLMSSSLDVCCLETLAYKCLIQQQDIKRKASLLRLPLTPSRAEPFRFNRLSDVGFYSKELLSTLRYQSVYVHKQSIPHICSFPKKSDPIFEGL